MARLEAQAVDVIAVEVRDDDHIDRFGREARRLEVVHPGAGCRRARIAVAGVDEHGLAAGAQHQRRVRHPHLAGWMPQLLQQLLDLGRRHVLDVALDGSLGVAVVDRSHLDGADAVTVEARRLLPSRG